MSFINLKMALSRAGGDSIGSLGIVTSLTLNMRAGELVNLWLTIGISVLTILYMVLKIYKELKDKK